MGSADGYLYALKVDGGEVKWRYKTQGFIESSPAISGDGTVYVGAYTVDVTGKKGWIYALGPDGTLVWSHDFHGESVMSSPAIGEDGTLYIATNKTLYAFKD